jgi:hypothetical protein
VTPTAIPRAGRIYPFGTWVIGILRIKSVRSIQGINQNTLKMCINLNMAFWMFFKAIVTPLIEPHTNYPPHFEESND